MPIVFYNLHKLKKIKNKQLFDNRHQGVIKEFRTKQNNS